MITNAKIVGVGVSYEDYSRQEFHRGDPQFSMSRSELMSFALNPKRWLDGYNEDREDTEATIFGSLVECLAGLNGKFDERYAVAPAEYKDEKTGKMKPWTFAANACKAWREEQGEREVIKAELFGKAKDAVAALTADEDVASIFACSKKQVMVCGEWRDKATGLSIPIRSLIDLVPSASHICWRRFICDLKTARNGNPDVWARVTDDSGYDIQAALSMALYAEATKEDRTDWVFVVQENVKPYHVVKPLPALSAEFITFGRAKYQIALRDYAQCLATKHWPSYSTGNRLVFGPCQYVGPETLWKYRETGGAVQSRTDYEPPPPPTKETEEGDVPH